jgi:hypothetical protein
LSYLESTKATQERCICLSLICLSVRNLDPTALLFGRDAGLKFSRPGGGARALIESAAGPVKALLHECGTGTISLTPGFQFHRAKLFH